MSKSDLPLLDWVPPCQFIPFPPIFRDGHAKRVAEQLASARTNREANFRLTRAMTIFDAQYERLGISKQRHDIERRDYLIAIHRQCEGMGVKWFPVIPILPSGTDPAGGAA